jgi:hypothetical protein
VSSSGLCKQARRIGKSKNLNCVLFKCVFALKNKIVIFCEYVAFLAFVGRMEILEFKKQKMRKKQRN